MSQRLVFMNLPNELTQIEIAQYLDIASYGAFSSTSVAIHKLLSMHNRWKNWVHHDLTQYPDLYPGENYQAYYKRKMYQEWFQWRLGDPFPNKTKYAFEEGLECLARRSMYAMDVTTFTDEILKDICNNMKADH